MQKNNKALKEALYSIILGYNLASLEGERVFIKHFGNKDKVEVDYQYGLAYNSALSKNVVTNEEKEIQLAELKLWSEKDDKEIISLELSIDNLKRRKRLSLPSQIKDINIKIQDAASRISKLRAQKNKLMGVTAESIAQRRAEDFYIASSFFRDDAFNNRLIHVDEFDDMDISQIDSMKFTYFSALSEILGEKIKGLSVLKDFMNLMYLAEKPYEILGKPLAEYTFFQIDLISFARHYKHIISHEPQPPDNILEDPDALDDWYESSNTMRKIMDKDHDRDSVGRATTIMGGTAEDLKLLEKEGDIVNLDTEIKKAAKHKPLNMQEMMKLHGIR
jgi:hypothetical protein